MCEFEMDIAHVTHMHFFLALKGLISFLNHGVGSQPWLPKKQLQGGLCKDAMRFGDSVLQTGYEIRQAVESFIQKQNVEGIVQARCSIL